MLRTRPLLAWSVSGERAQETGGGGGGGGGASKGRVWTRHLAPAAPAFTRPSSPHHFTARQFAQCSLECLSPLKWGRLAVFFAPGLPREGG